MAARMLRTNSRHILDPIPRLGRPPAKIHVFEPYWMEILVKAPQVFPHVAAGHEECARRLLHRTFAIQIAIQVSIMAIHGITWPQVVYPQKL
jgi:hypothetical protein